MGSSRTSYATQLAGKAPGVAPAYRQYTVAAAGLALGGLLLVFLPGEGWRMRVLLLLGMALGATLYLTSFSFTSAYRELLLRRETAGVRAQLLMLAFATVLFAPVLAAGSVFGYPISGAVAPVGMQVVAGAFLFGLGMQLAGGCGSGTLYAAGGGSARMLIVLAFFVAGSFWASLHMQWWQRLPSWGEIALGEALGWPAALALQLAVLAALWIALDWVGRSREAGPRDSLLQVISRHRLLMIGAVSLALLNFLTLITAGHPWSITWAFALWGAKLAQLAGWDPEASVFWTGGFQRDALAGGILRDVTSLMNIGIMIGAFAAAAFGGRFRPRLGIAPRPLIAAIIGGLVMGYGARIAYGCNIGAFFSGVASTSLHGWLWIAAALAGNWVGIRLRPGFGLAN